MATEQEKYLEQSYHWDRVAAEAKQRLDNYRAKGLGASSTDIVKREIELAQHNAKVARDIAFDKWD